MSDPAVKAAITAIFTEKEPTVRATAIAAAREALAPIRDLHRPTHENGQRAVCEHCSAGASFVRWPCDTARLAYTDRELLLGKEVEG